LLLVDKLTLIRATRGPNQFGLVVEDVNEYVWLRLVVEDVNEYVWLCRYLGQRSGPDTELRRDIWRVRGFSIGSADPRTSIPVTISPPMHKVGVLSKALQ
jgi:hypothetical protein